MRGKIEILAKKEDLGNISQLNVGSTTNLVDAANTLNTNKLDKDFSGLNAKATPVTGDILPIESSGTTYKIDYNTLATAILAQAVSRTSTPITFGGSEANFAANLVTLLSSMNVAESKIISTYANAETDNFLYDATYYGFIYNIDNQYATGIMTDNVRSTVLIGQSDGPIVFNALAKAAVVPVGVGGTGATTPAGARTNLEITPANIGAKATQSAVSDPTASGTAITFIDSISQNAQGVISPTKKTVQSASQSAAGLMSAADKTKLDGIAAGAQVNTITGIKGNAESSYRTGNVILTPANLGAMSNSITSVSFGTTEATLISNLCTTGNSFNIGEGRMVSFSVPANVTTEHFLDPLTTFCGILYKINNDYLTGNFSSNMGDRVIFSCNGELEYAAFHFYCDQDEANKINTVTLNSNNNMSFVSDADAARTIAFKNGMKHLTGSFSTNNASTEGVLFTVHNNGYYDYTKNGNIQGWVPVVSYSGDSRLCLFNGNSFTLWGEAMPPRVWAVDFWYV